MRLMASVARYTLVPSMIPEQDNLFLQVLDEDTILNGLRNETNSSKKTSILEGLRMSVRRNGGHLQLQQRVALFNAVHDVLLDNDVNTRLACLNLVSEVIPDFGKSLDECMSLILPQLVVFIGHNHVSLKKLAVQTLHVYMKHSEHLENVLNAIIRLGLESEDSDTQLESLIALPILITPNFADQDLFPLTEALARKIPDKSITQPPSSGPDTTSLALISLERIQKVVGTRNFERYVQQLQPRVQNILTKSMKSLAVEIEKNNSRKSRSAGVPVEDISRDVKVDKTKLDRGNTIANIGDEHLKKPNSFGECLPSEILVKLTNIDWRMKEHGIDDLRSWLNDDRNLPIVIEHYENFLDLLHELLNDSNFKVSLSCLQLFNVIIDKMGIKIERNLELFVHVLSTKFGDNKNVMKQTNMQVFQKLMQIISPKKILQLLKGNIKHRNSRVREETLNVIIASLLTFPSNKFDLPQVTSDVAPALLDPKSRVRHAALEAFAVISQVLGPRLQPLVSRLDSIELQVGGEGVMAAVQARFARRQLPKLNPEGLVEYAVTLPSSGSAKGSSAHSSRGADVDWILAGGVSSDCPSSARSTPGMSDSAPSPRRHLSAGKNRLPWENDKSNIEAKEEEPQKLKQSWWFEHQNEGNEVKKETSSYAVRYNSRKISNTADQTTSVTSYAQLHKSKSSKRDSTKSVKGSSLGPIINGTNGYSLIYKKGNNEDREGFEKIHKPLVRNHSIGAKSLSPFDSHLPKSPAARRKTGNMIGLHNSTNLSASLPDWSELSNRQKKLLSPVSIGASRDEEVLNCYDGHSETPIQIKPTLARSASKKGRVLKSIDFSDITSPRSPNTALLSPAPPAEMSGHNGPRQKSGGRITSPKMSEREDTPGMTKLSECKTWSAGFRHFEDDAMPFDTRPRIPRTPLKRRCSSDIPIDSPRDQSDGHTGNTRGPTLKEQEKDDHCKNVEDIEVMKKTMEVVGHAMDTNEKKRTPIMTSTLGSTSGIGSSLEESGELKAQRLLRDGNSLDVQDDDDYELEYEDDSDSEDSPATSDERHLRDGDLLKNYEEHVNELDHNVTSSDSFDDDSSEGESLEDSEGFDESDEDYNTKVSSSSEGYGHSRIHRQSLSKSTRERMERKRFEEEQRIMRDRQRIEELERQNHLKLESKEQSLREKIAKEQKDIENLIKRKEKEREKERVKQERLQMQLKKREETVSEEIWHHKNAVVDLELTRDVLKQKERSDTLKKLQQKENKDMNMNNFTVQGHHASLTGYTTKSSPTEAKTATNRPLSSPVVGDTMKQQQATVSPLVTKPPLSSSKKNPTSAGRVTRALLSQDDGKKSKQSHDPPVNMNSSSVPIWEIPDSDLKPFLRGDEAIKTALNQLADTEWESKCTGLLSVRRLIRHHTVDVCQQLHSLILAVVTEVKNLRSQVSRAAIFTLGDMFSCLEKNMDLDLEMTTNALIKKAGESSSFIRNDVENALRSMIKSVTPSKALASLVTSGSGHRNVNVRKTTAQFVFLLSERLGTTRCLNGSKEIMEKLLFAAATFAADGGAATRYYGRCILNMLDGHNEFEKMLNKYLPAKSLTTTMTIIENIRNKGLGDPPNDVSSAHSRKTTASNGGVSSRSSSIVSSDGTTTSSVVPNDPSPSSSLSSRESSRRRQRRVTHEPTTPQEQEEVSNLIEELSSKDWQRRIRAIDSMVEMIENRLNLFSANIVKIMDGFIPRLVDHNSKVNVYALQCLLRVTPTVRQSIINCISSLVPLLCKNFASKNINIANMAESALDSLIKHIDNSRLLQPLCQFLTGMQNKTAVIKLLPIIRDVYPRKPGIVLKYSLPVLWKLLEPSRSASSVTNGNMKEAVVKLSNLLYSLIGQSLFELAQAKSIRVGQRLHELLDDTTTVHPTS